MMWFTRFGRFNDDPNLERTFRNIHRMMDIRTKKQTLVLEHLSLTPLSESIMILYPSCMALKLLTHFLMHVPDHLLLFYFIYKVEMFVTSGWSIFLTLSRSSFEITGF
jgi:hypothetical protein